MSSCWDEFLPLLKQQNPSISKGVFPGVMATWRRCHISHLPSRATSTPTCVTQTALTMATIGMHSDTPKPKMYLKNTLPYFGSVLDISNISGSLLGYFKKWSWKILAFLGISQEDLEQLFSNSLGIVVSVSSRSFFLFFLCKAWDLSYCDSPVCL